MLGGHKLYSPQNTAYDFTFSLYVSLITGCIASPMLRRYFVISYSFVKGLSPLYKHDIAIIFIRDLYSEGLVRSLWASDLLSRTGEGFCHGFNHLRTLLLLYPFAGTILEVSNLECKSVLIQIYAFHSLSPLAGFGSFPVALWDLTQLKWISDIYLKLLFV